jgi:hypothetical protein
MALENGKKGAMPRPSAIDAEVALTWKQIRDQAERSSEPRYESIPKGGGHVRIVPRRPR